MERSSRFLSSWLANHKLGCKLSANVFILLLKYNYEFSKKQWQDIQVRNNSDITFVKVTPE